MGVLLLLATVGCSKRAGQDQVAASSDPQQLPAVQLAKAEVRQVERVILVTGSLQADESVSVSSEVAGRLATVRVDFGQRIRKGEIVAELDKQEWALQLERSKAALAQALARLGVEPGQSDFMPKSTPAIRQATAQLEDARFKYESARKLVETGDFSRERFIELEKAYHSRQAALEEAENDLRTQWASIQALRAEVKLAEKRLNDATVRAPFDGAVTARMVSPGQYLKENTPILTLVKVYPLRLRVDIPESATAGVRVGSSLNFTTDAAPGSEFHAIVRELNPALDAQSRSLTAEARLVEDEPRLRPGMFVQVRLVVSRNAKIVVVPKDALYTVAGLTKVFSVKDNQVTEHRIPRGQEVNGWMEVPDDQIRPGEQVAVSNLAALVDGVRVKVVTSAGAKS